MRSLCLVLWSLSACSGVSDPCAKGPVKDTYTLTTPGGTVDVTRAPFSLAIKDPSGNVVLQTSPGGVGDGYGGFGWTTGKTFWATPGTKGYYDFSTVLDPWRDGWHVSAATQTTDSLELTLGGQLGCANVKLLTTAGGLRVESHPAEAARAVEVAFQTDAEEAFLGFGERYNSVEQRGRSVYAWPEEGGLSKAGENTPPGSGNPYPNGEEMTYYPVPFFISTHGYGFWLDTTWRNQFDLALPDHPDAWRAWHIGGDLAFEVYLPVPGDARPWPAQVVDQFTARTGRPMIPVSWGFGPRRRIDPTDMQDGVSEIQAMRNRDLAITIADDATHFLPRGSELGREPELTAWTQAGKDLGYRIFGYYNPYFLDDPKSPFYSEVKKGLDNKWYLMDADGVPESVFLLSAGAANVYTVDVTNPAASAWFTGQFQRAITLGYSGWMYDFGEYVQPDTRTSTGLTGEQYHNQFPVDYQRAGHDALERSAIAGDWYFFARSGYTGSQAYTPMVWSGDPDASFNDTGGLPAQVRAGINLSLSGVAHFGSDIGGYKCLADGTSAADGELLARWIQQGSMESNMHDEDACAAGTGPKASIWDSPVAEAAWKTYARLHTRLQPYYLALAEEAHATGAPVLRHLYFENPERRLASVDDEYYMGPALLVAPVVGRGQTSRSVVFPSGLYLDWRDQVLYQAGTSMVSAPLDKLPLFLRDGQLVPLLDDTIDTLDERETRVDVISPKDVADVYDVVGLLSRATGSAKRVLAGGGSLSATYNAAFVAPTLTPAADEAALKSCAAGCWLATSISPRVNRIRITAPAGQSIVAGGLNLSSQSIARRLRWDLYLVD